MRRFCRLLFTFLFLSSIPAVAFATVEPTPNLDAVQNYSGPIVAFWDTKGAIDSGTQYYIFMSTTPFASADPATLLADPSVSPIIVSYNSGNAMRATITTFMGNNLVSGLTYNFRVAALNGGNWSASSSNPLSATSVTEIASIANVVTTVDGVPGFRLNFDTSTVSFNIDVRGSSGDPVLGISSLKVDIETSLEGSTVFLAVQTANVNINISSSNYSATAVVNWGGQIETHNFDKHNVNFDFKIWVKYVDSTGAVVEGWKTFSTVGVNVVHLNNGKGLVYQTVGSNQPSYGPPFYLDYYLSSDAFVTWKIWKHDGTLVRIVVSSVPRRVGDFTAKISDWDKAVHDEVWDGRNDQGLIVPNDIYYSTLDAYDYSTDHAITAPWSIAYDVLRLVDISASGITDINPLAHIKYTLAGANSLAGGATIKIAICSPGTTCYMAATAGSMPYLNGASTYTYTVGDPVPYVASNLKKVFVLARSAGSLDETWNGFDDSGIALPNNNYVFAISGTDDSGNHAIDNSGNDRALTGNITIDRTAAQTSSDSTPPTITGISAGGTNLALAGGAVLTQPFATLSVRMNDAGSGVDLAGSMIMLTSPTTNTITVTTANNGTDTINLTFPQQSANGTYTIRIRPRDKVGNTASDTIYNFTLNITASGASSAFAQSAFAYPNPVKNAPFVTFAYTVNSATTMKLEVFNILGALVYQESWTTPAGAQTKTWSLSNQASNKLATGVYLYRLTSGTVSATAKLKKLIIIQ